MKSTRAQAAIALRFVMCIAALLVMSDEAWSQYGAERGQWQILSARYGTARRNVDVTQDLKYLAKQGLTIRVTNKSFGTDPDPGQVKSLRIYARGPGGATRTFEYFENDNIDGGVFSGWSAGNWGQGGWSGGWGPPYSDPRGDRGQWEILQARWGTASRNLDVTQRLQDLARQNARFEVNNKTMGGDPADGVVKTLRIYARGPGGATRSFEYGENSYVDGALFTGWSSGNWGGGGGWEGGWGNDGGGPGYRGVNIVSAQYGQGPDRMDVTSRLQSMVRNGRISVRVNNDTMGSDPAPGRPKTLWVTYYDGRGQRQTRVNEKGQLTLP